MKCTCCLTSRNIPIIIRDKFFSDDRQMNLFSDIPVSYFKLYTSLKHGTYYLQMVLYGACTGMSASLVYVYNIYW